LDPGEGFNIIGTLLSGIVFWGLVGLGVDRLAGTELVFLPIGVLLGLSAGLYLVIYRLLKR
jgi:F0F1-type ATP synthase assembly protein I